MKMHQLIFTALILLACQQKPEADDKGTENNNEGLSDVEQFESVIPKSVIVALPEDTMLDNAETGAFCTELHFTGGKTFLLGKRWSAYVTSDTDDWITVNGKKTNHKVVDFPWYTISDNGN